MNTTDPIKQLSIADPELAKTVVDGLDKKAWSVSIDNIALLVEETIWGLSHEISFGRSIAAGYVNLVADVSEEYLQKYRYLVRKAGIKGPTLGSAVATHLVPVLKYGNDRLLESFITTMDIMQKKGTYTLKSSFEVLSSLINSGDIESSAAYLNLLYDTFSRDLSYNRSKHFSHILPRAVCSFSFSGRTWQVEQLRRVINTDHRLAEPFLEGMKKGLYLLSREALDEFVSIGLNKFGGNKDLCIKFLSLESKLGIDTCMDMQVTIPFVQVQERLNRYLQARTGLKISVRPISMLPESLLKDDEKQSICSDGKFIYLPDEISAFNNKEQNLRLYKFLTKLEAGYYEFNTFDFDLERVMEKCGLMKEEPDKNNKKDLSDLENFFMLFPNRDLAADLFNIFEHGRMKLMLADRYPGLLRYSMPLLQHEAKLACNENKPVEAVFLLYVWIVLGSLTAKSIGFDRKLTEPVKRFAGLFEKKIKEGQSVEACAELVVQTYSEMEKILRESSNGKGLEAFYVNVKIPFGRRLRPDLFLSTYRNFEQIAKGVKYKLGEKGIRVYKSDIRKCLIENNGVLTPDNIKKIIRCSYTDPQPGTESESQFRKNTAIDIFGLDLSGLIDNSDINKISNDTVSFPVSWHREWNYTLQDYINNHVRVCHRPVTGSENDFYGDILNRYRGLVSSIRYSFELLKPQGLKILRRWIEGDEFDYRELLDFVIDKKAGITPSERLYIKRIKQQRDVAVLLLVDISRSTANTVSGSRSTVLDVEKEAIVLFCEALDVLGDDFAIAGFSGTGRLGVDYFKIKEFNEKMDDTIRQRINAMTPQRSTRMGAAIRHAVSRLEKVSSKVRLLIILGDGFPNDTGYKQTYAIEDTRKAIFEARSKNIFVHAITVNLAGDARLDDLYGRVHHNVISDVRELPDKLPLIYSALTRH